MNTPFKTQMLNTLSKGDKFCKVKPSDKTVTKRVYTYQGKNFAGEHEYYNAHRRQWFQSAKGNILVTTDFENIP